jgi:hypothetical protein
MKLYVEHFIELLKAAPGDESSKYVQEIDGELRSCLSGVREELARHGREADSGTRLRGYVEAGKAAESSA